MTGVYNRNATNPGLKPNWWVRYWVKGEEIREPGKGGFKASVAYLADLKRQIKLGTWVHPRARGGGKARFDTWARTVIARRVSRGVVTADKDERGHVEMHLIPVFGELEMRELNFQRIRAGFAVIIAKGLAGRTIRNIHSTLRRILSEAAREGLIDGLPPPLTVEDDDLPPPDDKHEGWRDVAKFEREEIAKLLELESIVSLRRVMYATWFLTGARFSEITKLQLLHYNRDKQPLRSLSIHAAKVSRHRGRGRRRREVPVHPDLQAWLDWWIGDEYERLYGHKPGPEDYLFPTVSMRRKNRGEVLCTHNEIYKQWQRHDLPAAGLRHRRLHDARRTLLSALKNADVDNDLRRMITHRSVEDRVLDAYTTIEWKTLCKAMLAVQWHLPRPSRSRASGRKVVPLRGGS